MIWVPRKYTVKYGSFRFEATDSGFVRIIDETTGEIRYQHVSELRKIARKLERAIREGLHYRGALRTLQNTLNAIEEVCKKAEATIPQVPIVAGSVKVPESNTRSEGEKNAGQEKKD